MHSVIGLRELTMTNNDNTSNTTYYIVSALWPDGSRTVVEYADVFEALAQFDVMIADAVDLAAVWYCDRRWGVVYPVRRYMARRLTPCS